ncbi:MAG TPA: G/U mismatch-specific DNA glycosylase [Acidimicrobiales bacterium]|nr:G/U mismatch-specific DNA glycosylase [Acidimicrobiales bacterium]
MLAVAAGRTVPDVIASRLDVLFCGINPGLWSAAVGHHFARPGNRFWKVLHEAGFTPELLDPSEERRLLEYGLGVTNLVRRSSAAAAELTRDELREGARALGQTAAAFEPRFVAVLGMGAFRAAFSQPKAALGEQPWELSGARLWLLPNPSGLQARYQLSDLVREFGKLRAESHAP